MYFLFRARGDRIFSVTVLLRDKIRGSGYDEFVPVWDKLPLMPETAPSDPRLGKGEFTELAALARQYAGELKIRQIEIKTGVNRSTVSRILQGHAVNPAFLIQFAAGFRRASNPLLKAMGEDERFPDPTAPKEEISPSDQLLIDVSPTAELLGVSPETLASCVQDADIVGALKYVLENRVPGKIVLKWRRESGLYEGMMEGLRKSGAIRKRPAKKPESKD